MAGVDLWADRDRYSSNRGEQSREPERRVGQVLSTSCTLWRWAHCRRSHFSIPTIT